MAFRHCQTILDRRKALRRVLLISGQTSQIPIDQCIALRNCKTRNDVDMVRFETGDGLINLTIDPYVIECLGEELARHIRPHA